MSTRYPHDIYIYVYTMSTRYLHYVYTYDVDDIYTMSTYTCALSPIWVSWLTVLLHLQTSVSITPV